MMFWKSLAYRLSPVKIALLELLRIELDEVLIRMSEGLEGTRWLPQPHFYCCSPLWLAWPRGEVSH